MSPPRKEQKSQIYFSRIYRHLLPNRVERWIFLLGGVLPTILLFLLFYSKITYMLAVWANQVFSLISPKNSLGIGYEEFIPIFGGVYYVILPNKMPIFSELVINVVVTLLLLFILYLLYKKNTGSTSLIIYFNIILLIHLISCIFFIFAEAYFPYSATVYSELYIKQQIGIWLSIMILAGVIIGILGYGSILVRFSFFLGIVGYSLVYGFVRYITFMFIISKGSNLYMATLFFSLGPLFDFLYLVGFYGIYIYSLVNYFNQGKGRLKWLWL
ncbi:MAG: hypothetical protein AB7V16_01095 [Vulcanibacillus sp.]